MEAKKGGAPRDGQVALCDAIGQAVQAGRHLIGEAGTGTGKTYAYLAAATAALTHGRALPANRPDAVRRVVIVTATKALQEQLANEDIPTVAQALEKLGVNVRHSLLKGRNNYLCHTKLHAAGRDDQPDLFTSSLARKRLEKDLDVIDRWSTDTDTGDRSELPVAVTDEAWRTVSTGATECPGRSRCRHGDSCYTELARDRARTVELVVVNAALYATELVRDTTILGDHELVIIDEAHEFEAAVTDAATSVLSGTAIRNAADAARRASVDGTPIANLRKAADVLDTQCDNVSAGGDSGAPAGTLGDGTLVDLDDQWAQTLQTVINALDATIAELGPGPAEDDDPDAVDADDHARAVQLATVALEAAVAVAAQHHGYATWVRETRNGRRELVIAPIDVAGLLAARLWSRRRVVATSATLKLGGSLDAYARRMGADDYITCDVPSPFDYPNNAILYVAKHLPDPRRAEFTDQAVELTGQLIVAAGGRALSLHTSHRAMRLTAERLAPTLAKEGIQTLCQGDASRDTIVNALKESATAGGVAVFATQSFWTGVDVAGDGLSLVIIDKLPFARPTDPLGVARRQAIEERGGNAFIEIDVPRAATLLAQGAGRLIRTVCDRGVVAVMDQRLAVAQYRNHILSSLPPFRRSVTTALVLEFLETIAADATQRQEAG